MKQQDKGLDHPHPLVGRIKSTGKKVVMHSCGAVSDFVAMMIEMGIDALNPVQVSAGGMNPRDLMRRFGKDIAFWGGGCDTQQVLPRGTPEEVYAHTKRNIEIFKPGGGFVFSQVHNILPDVPPENIIAMFQAAASLRNAAKGTSHDTSRLRACRHQPQTD